MIELKQVDFHYGGENGTGDGVDALNLTIADGEVVVLCGESGCGKTTVTRLINGLIPHFYEGELLGEVLIDGVNVSKAELSDTAKKVGSVFQNPKSQFFNIDTTGELTFGCENLGMPREEIGRRLEKTKNDLKLSALMNRNIFELSGGEKQQIACGSVYAAEPEIFVMDEPSSNLDQKAIRRLHDTLCKMKQAGKTVVISEHRLHYLMDIADRFIYLEDGRITREFSCAEMRQLTYEELSARGLRCTSVQQIPCKAEQAVRQTTPALEVIDLSCSRQNARILDIDRIRLPEHGIVAVIGDNGCGKSTLAEAVCGLLPSDGTVSFGGAYLDAKQRQKQSYLVMQDVNRQLFADSVLEEVMLHADVTETDAKSTLSALGLGDCTDRHPASLSGGQKQRIAFARAILKDAPVIVLDEAAAFVDAENERKMRRAIAKITQGKTVIVIAHKLRSVQDADQIILLDDGQIAA